MTIPGRWQYNQWGGLQQTQAPRRDRLTCCHSILLARTDTLSKFFTLVSAIHALYLQLKWMRGDLFVWGFFDMTQTWQFQFKLLQTVSAQYKSRHMLLGQDVTCYFSLLYPCPGDKSVSFLSFWWVADCAIVVPTCQACLAQTLCCKCICLLLALDKNRQILRVDTQSDIQMSLK